MRAVRGASVIAVDGSSGDDIGILVGVRRLERKRLVMAESRIAILNGLTVGLVGVSTGWAGWVVQSLVFFTLVGGPLRNDLSDDGHGFLHLAWLLDNNDLVPSG